MKPGARTSGTEHRQSPPPAAIRILVLEDNPADLELIRRALRDAKLGLFRVTAAGRLRQALDLLARAPFEAILADLHLPDSDGFETILQLRAHYPNVPLLVLTGVDDESIGVAAMQQGAQDFIFKGALGGQSLARSIRYAMERHRLETSLREANEGLEQAVQARTLALQEREAGLRRAQLMASLAHVITGPDGAFESWSESLPKLIGVEPAHVPASTREWLELVHPEDRADFRAAAVEAGRTGRRFEHEYRLRRADGAWMHIRQVSEPLDSAPDGSGKLRWFGTLQDVTEQHRIAQDLRESEKSYRNLFEANPHPMWLYDPETLRFVAVNDAAIAHYGYSRDEFLAMSIADIRPQAEVTRLLESGALKAHEGVKEGGVWIHCKKDGSLIDVEITSHLSELAGRRVKVVLAHDVTERKRAEHELQRFRMAMDLSVDSIYVTDLATMRFIYVNDSACRRLGYTREQLLQLGPQDVLPGDREQINREYDAVVAAGDRGLRLERRFVRNDGSEDWSELHRRALHTESGTLIVTIGRDVTERKAAEERVRRLNRVYAMLSGINTLIVRARAREELFREACRIAVDAGQFRLAWIGVVDRDAGRVRPVAWSGGDEEYIQSMPLELGDAGAEGRGLAGLVIGERRAIISSDMTQDPRVLLKQEAAARGFRSLAMLPLLISGEAAGVLALYAGEAGFFDDEEMKLLRELAGDIAFAIEHLDALGKVEYLAFHDPLTGLPNRTVLIDRLAQMLSAARRGNQLAGVMFFDVERFRLVNDTLGRSAGDEFLKEVAERFKAAIRAQDTVVRVGADVFAVAVSGITSVADAMHFFVDRLTRAFTPPIIVGGRELRAVLKAGIAMFPNDGDTAEILCRNAEAALKKAKEAGDRYVFYTPELNARVAEALALENRLRGALEAGQFVLHYQPKVDTKTRALVGLEALIRWNDPELGLVPPGKFIPLMEETGIILQAGRWALKRAVTDIQSWRAKGYAASRVAVNVSQVQLRQPDFVQSVLQALEGFGDTEPLLDLEITESMVMQNLDATVQALQTLRGAGVETSLDDFGTGYSSLAYVSRLPVVALKIDRSFVVEMTFSHYARTIVQTVISLAHSLGLKVIAEGVDAEEQATLLATFGCDQMQGYLISRPVPPEQIEAMLQKA
jgi:diguanylate cyclase (GGDEF)-like protein/PAS domain S-box-containing protein